MCQKGRVKQPGLFVLINQSSKIALPSYPTSAMKVNPRKATAFPYKFVIIDFYTNEPGLVSIWVMSDIRKTSRIRPV
jgi:hypothetical protein